MRIAVVQLCRLGDVVQTLPMTAALRREGHEVDLIVRPGFDELPLGPAVTSSVRVLPTLDGGPAGDLRFVGTRLEALASFLTALKERRYDLAINLAHDEESQWLTLYLDAGSTRGVVAGRDRNPRAADGWTRYLLALPGGRAAGAFNLTDVYCRLAGVAPGEYPRLAPLRDDRMAARRLLGIVERRPPALVGLVPGASDARKRWPAAEYAAVARALLSAGVSVCVLGTVEERGVAAAVRLGADGRVVDLAGRTRLPLLCAVLAELDLVITNDTGAMHVAAAVGTRTLALTLGPAAAHETAPFGEGHLVVEPEIHCHPCDFAAHCSDAPCHGRVPAGGVAGLALSLLFPDERRTPPSLPGARLYRTTKDSAGRIALLPVERYPLRGEDVIRSVYRRFWESSLGKRTPCGDGADVLASLLTGWDTSSAVEVAERLATLEAGLGRLAEIAERSCVALLEMLEHDSGRASSVDRALATVTTELSLAGELEPLLRPFTDFALMELQLSGSHGPRQVLTGFFQALSSAANRARSLRGLVAAARRGLLSRPAPVVAG